MTKKTKLACGAIIALLLFLNAAIAVGLGCLISFQRGQIFFHEARVALTHRDYDTAITRYTAALEQRSTRQNKEFAYENRAYCEAQKGRRDEAVRDYSEALRLNPVLDRIYTARGLLYEHDKDLEKAFSDYSEAIRYNPNAGSAYYRRGLIFKLRHDNEKAITDFSEAARCQPNNAAPYRERGDCYFRENDLDSALASFDAAISIQPNNASAYFQRGHVYREKGQLEKAKSEFARAAELSPKYKAIQNAQIADSNRERSIADLTETLQKNPKDKKALEARGLAYSKQGDHKRAITDFSELLQIARTRRAFDYRAWAHARLAEYANAIADYKQGAEESGPVTVSVKELAWLLATCPDPSFRDGKEAVTEATEDCERTAWKNWNCLDTLAAAYAENGDFDGAVRVEEKALGFNDVVAEQRQELQKRLVLYRNHQPFRDEPARHN